jgi:hypothetical protein
LPQTLANSAVSSPVSVGVSAVARHAAHRQAEESDHALSVMGELTRLFTRVNLLFDACDAWLRDADDPSKYDIGPRAEEVTVTYTVQIEEGVPPLRCKASLQELVRRVERSIPGSAVIAAESKYADPRELVLKTASQLQGQTQLLMSAMDKIHNAQEEERFRTAILTAIAEVDPDVRQRIIDHLQRRGPLGTLPR